MTTVVSKAPSSSTTASVPSLPILPSAKRSLRHKWARGPKHRSGDP